MQEKNAREICKTFLMVSIKVPGSSFRIDDFGGNRFEVGGLRHRMFLKELVEVTEGKYSTSWRREKKKALGLRLEVGGETFGRRRFED